MIDFACETISMEDLIRCSFSLKKSEYKVLKYLIDSESKDVKSITENLSLERSTVHKSLQSLLERDLISRRQYNVSSGGYKYVYRSKPKEKIKERVLGLIQSWASAAEESIKNW